ncbi:hypothetical protein [Dactylosporangium matsuzakiense]|uniref:Coronafacic acid synthetase n=1 Tax=Dactylosporangium matsuzakiense TaxID=53360 RepID=A0A9W6KXJ0_9ACTN|nr:hypothetical protein [Dactylosporangium matsuzakiense]UWZ42288.1 hypothetical protein Dmats_32585 [Dactylosporangium matsuzakiense]GLL07284.1 coronafacic acid synthetase [Dactylosporangium matsuzakiense]
MIALAYGEADTADARNAPSFFVDPAGWLVNTAVSGALQTTGALPTTAIEPDEVAVIVVSDICSATTMASIAASAERGVVSPLRFAGANPGVLAGLPCIRGKLRGPSLTLTMPPDEGLPVAAVVAAGWLRDGHARHVVLATYAIEAGRPVARCAVVR